MSYQILWSDSALEQVTGILDFLAEESPEAAERLITDLRDRIGALSDHPYLTSADQAFDEQRWSDARDAYGKYLESIPDNLNARSDLGYCLRQLGELKLAVEQFDMVLDQEPDHFAALFNKTLVVGLDLGRKKDAKPFLARLLKIQPDSPEVKVLAERLEGN